MKHLSFTRIIENTQKALPHWVVLPYLFSLSISVGIFGLIHSESLGSYFDHKIEQEWMMQIAYISFGVFLSFFLTNLGLYFFNKKKGISNPFSVTKAFTEHGLATLSIPFLVTLMVPSIESKHPIWTTLLCGIIGIVVAFATYKWHWVPNFPRYSFSNERTPIFKTALSIFAVMLIGGFYGGFFSNLALTNHVALGTSLFDLGIYDNVLFNSANGNPLGCSFMKGGSHASAHFDPILLILAPFYSLYPNAKFLLVFQSFWLASGVVPLYFLARHQKLCRATSLIVLVLYILFPALHGANLYDFHSLTLIVPLVFWLILFLEKGLASAYFFFFALLLLCREDVPLLLCFVGFYALQKSSAEHSQPTFAGLSLSKKYRWIGILTILLSITYLILAKKVFMPSGEMLNSGKGSYSYAYYFKDLIPNGGGFKEIFLSLVTNPTFILKHILLNDKKILYFLLLFLPLGFLPFFARRGKILLIFGMALCFLATRKYVYTVHFQYSSWLIPILFTLLVFGLKQIQQGSTLYLLFPIDPNRINRTALAFLLTTSLLISWKFGAITENTSFRGGFRRVTRTLTEKHIRRYNWLEEALAKIPEDASVQVNSTLGPHVTNREKVYRFGDRRKTDFILLNDRKLKKTHKQKIDKLKKSKKLKTVTRHGNLVLYQYQ